MVFISSLKNDLILSLDSRINKEKSTLPVSLLASFKEPFLAREGLLVTGEEDMKSLESLEENEKKDDEKWEKERSRRDTKTEDKRIKGIYRAKTNY